MPACLVTDRLVKYVTVTGTIGNTQGVNKAINPPRIPSKNSCKRLLRSGDVSPQSVSGGADEIFSMGAEPIACPPSNDA